MVNQDSWIRYELIEGLDEDVGLVQSGPPVDEKPAWEKNSL